MTIKLLENISYYVRMPRQDKDLLGDELMVVESFPFNPKSKTAPHTAKSWAMQGWGNRGETMEPPRIDLSNNPFSIKIIGLSIRSNGGRAYKVIDDNARLFDAREDQVLESIARFGIAPGGQLGGTFVWATSGSQIKLVLVDGKLHTAAKKELNRLIHADATRKTGNAPTLGKLIPGKIYQKRNTDSVLYIGMFSKPKIKKKPLHMFLNISSVFNGQLRERLYYYFDNVTQNDFDKMSDVEKVKLFIKYVTSSRGTSWGFKICTSIKLDNEVSNIKVDVEQLRNSKSVFDQYFYQSWYTAYQTNDVQPQRPAGHYSIGPQMKEQYHKNCDAWTNRAWIAFKSELVWGN